MNLTITNFNVHLDVNSKEIGEIIMSAASSILAAVEASKAASIAAIARVADDVTFLKNKATAGETITPEEAQAILDGLAGITSALNAIDPVPENPA